MEALKCAYDSAESESDGDQRDVTEKHITGSTEPEIKRAKTQPCYTKDVPRFTLRGISREQPHGQRTPRKFEETTGAAGGGSLSFWSHGPNVTTDMAIRANRLHAVTHESVVEQSQRNSWSQQPLTSNAAAKQSAAPKNEDNPKIRRYIPKREREKTLTANTPPAAQPLPQQRNTEGDLDMDQNQPELVSVSNSFASPNRPPKKVLVEFSGHTKGVNCVRWCPQKADLLLSASMDHSIHLWDVRGGHCIRKLERHGAAVKDARWSHCGTRVLSCGYDKMARITDAQTGQELQHLVHKDYATCVQYHPTDPNLFLVGTFKSNILCWDSRSAKVVSMYSAFFGQVQDLAFLPGGDAFVSAAEVVRRNSADKGIMVWDFRSTAILSNQIYQEAFTCTCLQVHPSEAHFIAQSSGDYVAIFSTKRPYKLNKLKRYEGHKVSGYHIGCDFSPDGSIVASGSSDGSLYFYNQHTSRIIKTISGHSMACMDVAYHPSFPSTVASCGWDGTVVVWQ